MLLTLLILKGDKYGFGTLNYTYSILWIFLIDAFLYERLIYGKYDKRNFNMFSFNEYGWRC